MLHLIIDGYNLIRQIPELERREKDSLEAGRHALLCRLRDYHKIKPCKITVVFDGRSDISEFAATYKEGGISVCFSADSRSADDVIKEFSDQLKTRAIVVSSDRSVVTYARMCGCAVIDSVSFFEKLKLAAISEIKGGDVMGKDEEVPRHKRWMTYKKGPSKKLPKKARQNKIKLDKL